MNSGKVDFSSDDEVLSTFVEETGKRTYEIEWGLIGLEKNGHVDPDEVRTMFRAAHSIKAGANLLDLPELEGLAHRLENILQRFRTGDFQPSPELISLMLEGVDVVRDMARALDNHKPMPGCSDLVARLDEWTG
jgi:two-component system chemotaxis sensor kinase CheA